MKKEEAIKRIEKEIAITELLEIHHDNTKWINAALKLAISVIKQIEVPESASCQSDKMTYEEQWVNIGKKLAEIDSKKTISELEGRVNEAYGKGLKDGKDSVVKEQYTILKVNRQPYKCPVCGGGGKVFCRATDPDKPCHSCNGTGIVWG